MNHRRLASRRLPIPMGIGAIALLLGTAGSSLASLPARAASPGPVAEWTFAEGSGQTVEDSSGTGLTGSLRGSVHFAPGRIGTGLRFGKSSGWVDLGPNVPLLQNTSAASFACFAMLGGPLASGASQDLVAVSIHAAGKTDLCRAVFSLRGTGAGARVHLGARSNDTEAEQALDDGTSLVPGIWYHLTGVIDFAHGTLQIYVNGVLSSSGAASFGQASTPNSASSHAALGSLPDGDGGFFQGSLDEVQVYHRVLSGSEVQRLADAQELEAQWALDEGAGLVAGDSSGDGIDGTLKPGTSWTTGISGNGLLFDGRAGTVSVGSELPLLRNVNAATVAAWINPSGPIPAGMQRDLLSLSVHHTGAASDSARIALSLQGDGTAGDLLLGARSTDSEPLRSVVADTNLAANRWYHVAGVVDFAAGTLTTYLNGVQVGRSHARFAQSHTPNTSVTQAALGSSALGDTEFFGGILNDVRIYGRPLSGTEIQLLSGNQGLRGYWKLDEGSGMTAADSSGNGFTGTLRNGVNWAVPGKIGNALNFDGVNGTVALPSNLPILSNVPAATLSCWVNPAAAIPAGAFQDLLSISTGGGGRQNDTSRAALALQGTASGIRVFAGARSTDMEPERILLDATTLGVGTWAHVAATMDFAGKRMQIFVNGTLTSSATVAFDQARTPQTRSRDAALGSRAADDGDFLHGMLDEVRVYGRVLSTQEILGLATPVPAVPTNLAAVPGDGQVALTWTASTGATAYHVKRSTTSGGPYTTLVTASAPSFVDTGLTNGTAYFYVVSALNLNGESGNSAQVTAVPAAAPVPPPAPSGLSATPGDATVILSWNSSAGATTYNVKRATSPGGPFSAIGSTALTTFTDSGLVNGTTYFYEVDGQNVAGTGPYTAPVSATPTAPLPPPVPTGLSATPGNAQVALSWNPSLGATSYNILRSTVSGGPYVQVGNVTSGTAFTDFSVTNGTAYFYVVAAVNDGGTSANSAEVSALPLAPPPAPSALIATPGNATVILTWPASPTAASYQISRSTLPGGPFLMIASGVAATTYTDSTVTNGTTYFYVVSGVNVGGIGPVSPVASATPVAPPPAPTGLLAQPGNAQVILTWTAAAGATGYNVLRSTTTGGPYAVIGTATTPFFPDLTATNGTPYFYVVTATNAGGESPPSNEASATPQAPPAAPTSLVAVPGNAQVALTWTVSPTAASYRVKRATVSGGPYTVIASGLPTPTFTDTGLVNATTYFYVVTAVNVGGESPNSNEASATPVAPPAPPTGLTAVPGSAQATLSWTASGGATSYNVKRSTTSGGPYAIIATAVTVPSFTDLGLQNGTTYFYVVSAINGSGESANSNEASATPVATPPAPTNLVASAGNAQVSLTWTAAPGATSYKVFRSITSGTYGAPIATGVTSPAYVDSGLVNGTTYFYVVRATNSAGDSAPSNEASATPNVVPVAPTGLTATAGNTQISLAWSAVSGATSYKVFRSTTSGSYGAPLATGVMTPTFLDTGLVNGTTYFYIVRAMNSAGDSAPSNEASATPAGTPAPPTGLTAIAGNTQVSLTWIASPGATSYKVFRSTTSGTYGAPIASGVTTASFTDTGLTNGTTYFYVVRASNSAGDSAPSNEASATPNVVPTAPTGLTVTAGNAQISLSWTAVSGTTSYKVFRSTTSGTYGAPIATGVTSPAYVDSGLVNGTTYFYVVRATNSAGDSAPSNEASATPNVVPTAPTGLAAAAGNAQVSLTWTAVSGATSYKVFRSTTSGTYGAPIASGVTTPAFVDTGLVNGTTYFYVVRASNSASDSAPSNEASATPITVPPAPRNLLASPSDQQITLTWSPAAEATSYKVFRSTVSGSYGAALATGVLTTAFTDTGLTDGTTYFYVVRATNSAGDSTPSNEASAVPNPGPPAPTGLTAVPGNQKVSLTWTASSGALSYKVFRSTVSGTYGGPIATGVTTTSYPDTGLTNGTTYFYVVRATTSTLDSGPSNEASAIPNVPPPAPTALSAVVGDTQVTLSWAAVPQATGYKVFRSTTSGAYGAALQTGLTATAYLDTGLTDGTTYFYIVKATNSAGDSTPSNQVAAIPNPVPAPPATVTLVPGDGTVTVAWSTSPGATSYKVFRSTTSGVYAAPVASGLVSPPLVDAGLVDGTTYFYVVRATNSAGDSAPSPEASTIPNVIPSPPTGLAAAAGNAQVTLSWTASPAAASYKLFRSTTSGTYGTALATGVLTTSYVDTANLTNGTTYFYVVHAVNLVGESGNSNEVSSIPGTPPPPVLTSAVGGQNQVTIQWNASIGATGYKVYRSTVSGNYTSSTPVPATNSPFTDTGLSNGTTYFYVVSAVNAVGESPKSNELSATAGTPAPPVLLTAVSGNQQVTLTWSSSTGAVTYNVYRALVSGAYVGITPQSTSSTTFVDTGLTNGQSYFYVVTAINQNGQSPQSNELSTVSGPPAAPTLLSPVPGDTKVSLSWSASPGATGYKVYRATASGAYAGMSPFLASGTSFIDTGLTDGTVYYYVVSATDAAGDSPFSNEKFARPFPNTPDTTPPTLALDPADTTKTTLQMPAFSATYSDTGSGINPDSFIATIDVNRLTSNFAIGPTAATWTPTSALPDGPHSWSAEIHDFAGNVAQASANYRIVAALAQIGSAGGSLAVTDQTRPPFRTQATFPAGAVTGAPVVFSIENVAEPAALPAGFTGVGPTIRMDPPATFGAQVTLSVPYVVAQIPSGVAESSLRLLRFDVASTTWVLVPALPNDTTNHLAIAQVGSFGNEYFTVAAQVPADSLTDLEAIPAEVPADGASFSTVTVIPRDSEGRIIGPGLAVTVAVTGTASVGPVQDVGDGAYRALVSSSTPGTVTVSAAVGGVPVVKTPPVQIAFLNSHPTTFTIDLPPTVHAGDPQTPTVSARRTDGSVEDTFVGVVRIDITGTISPLTPVQFPATLYAVFSRRDLGVVTLDQAVTFVKAGPQTVSATLMTDPTVQGSTTVTVLNAVSPLSLIAGQSLTFSGAIGTISPFALTVQAVDPFGNPAVGQAITFTLLQGGATFVSGPKAPVTPVSSPATATTGPDGTAVGPFVQLPTAVGTSSGQVGIPSTDVVVPFTANALSAASVGAAPVILLPLSGSSQTTPMPSISGTGLAGARIDLVIDNLLLAHGTVGGDGSWQITTPILSQGSHTIYALQSTLSFTPGQGLIVSAPSNGITITVTYVTPAAPFITTLPKKTNRSTPRIDGTIGGAGPFTILLFANGQPAGQTQSSQGVWSIPNATPGATEGTFTFTARAVSAVGISSPDSNPVEIVIDVTPPAPPDNLAATPGNGFVLLSWAPSPSDDTLGYNVWRRLQSQPDSSFTKINGPTPVLGTRYCDKSVSPNTSYVYRVTSVDDAVNEQGQ